MSDIDVGACGCLQGLEKSPHLNGRRAVVVDTDMLNKTGRVAVHLFPKKKKNNSLLIKIHNLKLDIEGPGDCSGGRRPSDTFPTRLIEFCSYCSAGCKDIKVCGKCRLTTYCSRECQVQHWKMGHKNECSNMKKILDEQSFTSGCDPTKMNEKELWGRVEATFAKVSVYRDKKKWSSAEKLLRATIDALKPVEENHPFIFMRLYMHLVLVIVHIEGRIDEAVTLTEHAIALENKFDLHPHIRSRTLLNFGTFLKKQGDYERAIAVFSQAYEMNPEELKNILPWVADMYMRMHNHDKAEEVYCKFLKILGPNRDTEDQRKTAAVVHSELGAVRADRFFKKSFYVSKLFGLLSSEMIRRETGLFLQDVRTAMELRPDVPYYSHQMAEYEKCLRRHAELRHVVTLHNKVLAKTVDCEKE